MERPGGGSSRKPATTPIEPPSTPLPPPSATCRLALGLAAGAVLVNQLALLRVFSVTMWYHFAFLAICLAMLGMSAAGAIVHAAPGFFRRERLGAQLAWCCTLSGVALAAGLIAFLRWPVEQTWDGPPPLAQAFACFLPPFLLSGFVPTLLFAHRAEHAGPLYFADLVGAALGCLATIGLLTFLTGPETVAVTGAGFAVAGALFALDGGMRRLAVGSGVAAVAIAGLVAATHGRELSPLKITRGKSYDESKVLFELWNPLSRVTVFDGVFWRPDEGGFKWGGTTVPGEFKPREKWIEQDGNAGTPVTEFDGDISKYTHLERDATFVAYALRPYRNAFIIGPGGGRDILGARRFEVPRIVAAELNPSIVKVVDDPKYLADFAGRPYSLPGVEARVGEGRSTLLRSGEQFDLIQISLIDSWAATLAGAFVLVENNLYTREAFQLYWRSLTDDGVLTVSRWRNSEFIRLVVLAVDSLRSVGVERPFDHIAVFGTKDLMTLVLGRRPFDEVELGKLGAWAAERDFEIFHLPGRPTEHPEIAALMAAPDVETYARSHPLDVSPPTDDRPFFFQMDKSIFTRDWARPPAQGVMLLRNLAMAVAGFTAALVLLPTLIALLRGRSPREAAATVARESGSAIYFMAIGVAYMTVEIALVQRFILFLGHPIYATSVVLFSMLLFSGVGSWVVGRLPDPATGDRSVERARILAPALLLLALAATIFLLPPLLLRLQGLPLGGRIAISVAVLALLGGLMGMPFPAASRILHARGRAEAIPWLWSLNGAASVLASVAAILFAIRRGYSWCLFGGMICYGMVLIVAWIDRERPERS